MGGLRQSESARKRRKTTFIEVTNQHRRIINTAAEDLLVERSW